MDRGTALLDWYRPRRRIYPWRAAKPDPYRVLVSEVMLQQTQVARVIPRFREFIGRFPTVRSLAAAPRHEVLRAWSGLGYNRRAVSLSEAARIIVRDHGGRVPWDPETLLSLPGVGQYTAAAVASLAYGVLVPALDTNAVRVLARAGLGAEPDEVRRPALEDVAAGWLDRSDPGGWNQALMDLGREVCRPVPWCGTCPMAKWCRFRAEGGVGRPVRGPRTPFPGSMRQVRGAIIHFLRDRNSASVETVARHIDEPGDRVSEAVRALAGEGLVEASPAAMAGRSRGRIRLPRA